MSSIPIRQVNSTYIFPSLLIYLWFEKNDRDAIRGDQAIDGRTLSL